LKLEGRLYQQTDGGTRKLDDNRKPLADNAGAWDLYTMLADAHGWTPAQVDAMDPDFIFELSCFKTAQAQYAERERERAQREADRKRRRR
jgi:hypothetical protein